MAADKHDEGKSSSFKVSDRRSFSESGDPKPAPEAAAPEPSAGTPTPPEAVQAPSDRRASDAGAPQSAGEGLLPVDFHTFILSLGSSALLHLGELDQPDGSESPPDLRIAKHTIDIIAMLQTKTKGNLSPPEERLIESLLYDLRLRYVEHTKNSATK